MAFNDDFQKILMGQRERLYREFRDGSTAHSLVNPTRPRVTVYDPDGAEVVASTAPTQEDVGVFYYQFNVTTAASTKEGVYQAYWEGFINGAHVTMDVPQYFLVSRFPWDTGETGDFVNSIRRLIGDTNPENYRISSMDIWYYIGDSINDVQAELNLGYTFTISNTTGLALNKALTAEAASLFRFRTLILILNSVLFNGLFCAGNVTVGDIRVNVTNTMRERREMLKYLDQEYLRLMYNVKMNGISGVEIDTFVTGIIRNTILPIVTDINLGNVTPTVT